MKKKISVLLILVVTLVFTAMNFTASASTVAQTTNPSTIETNGTSEIEVAPDIAYINVNVNVVDQSKEKANSENKDSTNKMINALVKSGVAKNDIKSMRFNVSSYIDRVPVNPNDPKTPYKDVKRYQTSANLKVTVRDISKVSDALDSIIDIENVNISNVSYAVNDVTKYKKDAISKAVSIAKENISYAADASGVKLDKLQSMTVDFSNNSSNSYPVYLNMKVAADSSPVYQNPDNIKVSASVHMVYTTK